MDSITLHIDIAREYNISRKPVFEKFIQAYDGEIKYVFSDDYIIGFMDRDGFSFSVQYGTTSTW